MELTQIERQLWNDFQNAVMNSLDKQFSNNNAISNPITMSMMIDSCVDMFALTYCKISHNGISSNRVNEIINAEANLIKRKLKERLF